MKSLLRKMSCRYPQVTMRRLRATEQRLIWPLGSSAVDTISPLGALTVEPLPAVGEVPEAVQAGGRQHHGEVVLVRAPEQLLVRHARVGVRERPGARRPHQRQDEAQQGDPGPHVWATRSFLDMRGAGLLGR
ncbi:hypothetical protein EYF80_037683 [Liparis tanakae]|uniref:Uncharacterized protein n=1 Tax=Liparis tanakae TaxID=230148 RepID=A0A4Z2GHA8_9TELE|nr:hypothetical protein EYF80_037683 [Liparis tanakae]